MTCYRQQRQGNISMITNDRRHADVPRIEDIVTFQVALFVALLPVSRRDVDPQECGLQSHLVTVPD